MDRETLALAAFALGRFVQYRLDEGMAADDLRDFMQAYLNLTAWQDGIPPIDLCDMPPTNPADIETTPAWANGYERLRAVARYLKSSGIDAAATPTSVHDILTKALPALYQNVFCHRKSDQSTSACAPDGVSTSGRATCGNADERVWRESDTSPAARSSAITRFLTAARALIRSPFSTLRSAFTYIRNVMFEPCPPWVALLLDVLSVLIPVGIGLFIGFYLRR